MSQVPVKWVRSKHELWDRQVQANTTSPDMAVPVVPLSALREVVEGLKCAEYALAHPSSDQQFAINAVRTVLAHLDAEGVK